MLSLKQRSTYVLSCFSNSGRYTRGSVSSFFWGGGLRWVFIAARRLSLVVASGGYCLLRCAGFSLRWLLLLQSTGSRCAGFNNCGSQTLERRLSSGGTRA